MDNITDTSVITAAVDAWFNPELLARAVSNFVHTRWAQVKDIPAKTAATVRFRRYGNLTAATTALTEGMTPAGSALSKTDITATPLQYGDYVTGTDVLDFTSPDPVLMDAADVLGDQAGDTVDQLTRDVIVACTTKQFASSATQASDITDSMKLNTAEVREAVLTLQENKAKYIKEMIDPSNSYNTIPVGKCYVGIIHPRTLRDLKGETAFTKVKDYPSQSDVMEDEVGALDEVRFVMTPNAKVVADGNSSANVYRTIIMGRDFYGITRITGETLRNIVKALGSAGTADPLEQRWTSGWKLTFIAKRLNETFAVVVYHGATQ